MVDGNLPGLRVCRDDWDELDPYRLPARQTENITLPFVRPDVPIAVQPAAVVTFYLITEGSEPIMTEDDDHLITETA